ncbi:MAG: DinB family protein [Acidobacteriota bacterium]|nr:DinB family protein [Acidobacteriota bacterium]
MELDERKRLIAQYRDGYAAIVAVLLKITPEELDARPAPGRWSPREILHHLADSEMTAAVRLRVLLAEDRPAIHGYDQDQFARSLHYDRPHETSLELFRWAREATAELLELLTPEEWLREGTHTEAGPFGVEAWLKTYAGHAHRHARQISEARSMVGKRG